MSFNYPLLTQWWVAIVCICGGEGDFHNKCLFKTFTITRNINADTSVVINVYCVRTAWAGMVDQTEIMGSTPSQCHPSLLDRLMSYSVNMVSTGQVV